MGLQWQVFDAQEAHEAGLVRSIHEPEELLSSCAVALEIAENTSAVSVTMIRHMMWRMLGADHPMEAHKIDSRGIYHLGQGADAHEGSSFVSRETASGIHAENQRGYARIFPLAGRNDISSDFACFFNSSSLA